MKKLLIAICALIILGLVSCDESTPNPTDNNNDNIPNTKEDLLASTMWERPFLVEINTPTGPIPEWRMSRLEFNKGLRQQTFFYYIFYQSQNDFLHSGDQVKWTYANDTITLQGNSGLFYTTKLKVLKLTEDTLRFERINPNFFLKAPFEDKDSIHTYYKVK